MRRAAAVAALGVACLAGGAYAAAPSQVSLSLGSPTFSGTTVTALPAYGARGTDVVDYQDGARLRVVVPVRSDGLPVRVTGADLVAEPISLIRVVSSTVRDGSVVLETVLGNCKYFHEREIATYPSLRVRYSVLGRSAESVVDLQRPLLVHAPMIVGCPDRKLDRQADNRTDP